MAEIILEQQHRHQVIVEKLYTAFLKEADGIPEVEWQYLAVKVAQRILEGAELSLWAELQPPVMRKKA